MRTAQVRERDSNLRLQGFLSYSAYLRSPQWSRVKAAYRASDLPQICMCGEEQVDLHHITYERVGHERIEDLLPLCRRCHTMIHVLERRGDIGLDLSGFDSAERAADYAAARAEQMAKAYREFTAALTDVDRARIAVELAIADLAELAEDRGLDVSRQLPPIRRRLDAINLKLQPDVLAQRQRAA